MDIREYLKNNLVILDGAMGTLLQSLDLGKGERSELWNLTRPEIIERIHREYFDAGANVATTNTFGANIFSYDDEELEKMVEAAINLAKAGRDKSVSGGVKLISMSVGPTGKLLKPYGSLDFEEAVSAYSKLADLGEKYGADMFSVETISDSLETKAAILGIKEVSDKPVMVTNAYGRDQKLLTGAGPEVMCAIGEAMGVDAIGLNCSTGPKEAMGVLNRLIDAASIPVIFKPNGGLPRIEGGTTVYSLGEEEFAAYAEEALEMGAGLIGGCCGTTPSYIKELADRLSGREKQPTEEKTATVAASYTHIVNFDAGPVLIGERINPTGKKNLRNSLIEGDMTLTAEEAISQQEEGAAVLDVNCGLREVDEAETLKKMVEEIQAVSDLPLQLDTGNPEAMKKALRVYNGKAILNSVNGTEASMEAIFPLAKKYGAALVCLTFDERGIPETIEERVEIAEKIIEKAAEQGIKKKDLIFDTLTLTAGADQANPEITLKSMKAVAKATGCHTVLGISNVSFGLPHRAGLNGAFLAMALERGLSAAIIDTSSKEVMTNYYGFKALKNQDANFEEYMSYAKAGPAKDHHTAERDSLKDAVIKGLTAKAEKETKKLLITEEPMDIVSGEIIPALDQVGRLYEEEKIFLPQLLMSAEAATKSFNLIKTVMEFKSESGGPSKGKFVIATVKGDIHDIGKNIVALLLESYGFQVFDLGKDVEPEAVVEAAKATGADVVGLSALMTTNLKYMEDTVRLLREEVPGCKIVVGGAVLTEEYADFMGADCYGHDAMATVRFAEEVCRDKNIRGEI